MAFWLGSEIYAAGGSHTAVTLKPGKGGVLKVTLNGEVVFDKAEAGKYPALPEAKEIKGKVISIIEDTSA